jgi:high-affinity Fe2+/Pb2+ permease
MFHHQHLKMKDAFWTFLKVYCSSKVIIAKDLTIQQRDQNKKKRELKNKNNKQSLQKTKASEMKTIQEEVDDMEIQNCQDTSKTIFLCMFSMLV